MNPDSYFSTSVDDLRSTLACALSTARDKGKLLNHAAHLSDLLDACPADMPSKRKVIETELRKARKELSAPPVGAQSSRADAPGDAATGILTTAPIPSEADEKKATIRASDASPSRSDSGKKSAIILEQGAGDESRASKGPELGRSDHLSGSAQGDHSGSVSRGAKGGREVTLATLDVMPACPSGDDEWANARRLAQMAEGFSQASVVAQIMCGFELIELQKRMCLTRGGDRKSAAKPNRSVLNWPKLVRKNIGRSDDTARNWMNMARAVAPRIKKLDGPWEAPTLLALPPAEWPQEARASVEKTLRGICEGHTQSEFMRELGLIRGEAKRKGGAREKGGDDGAPQKPADWTEEAWERYIGLPAEQREAIDLVRPAINAMHDLGDPEHSPLPFLPAAERRELEAAHRRVGELLASIKSSK